MNFLILILAGIVGSSLMVLFLEVVDRMGWQNADLVRALGSLFDKKNKNLVGPGLVLHYTMGCIFAWVYATFVHALPLATPITILTVTTLLGLMHGMIVGLMLIIFIAEHHPLKRYRDAGIEVAAVHVLGHIFYGLGVGATLALLPPSLFTVWELPQGVYSVGIFTLVFAGVILFGILFIGLPIIFMRDHTRNHPT